MSRVKGAYPPVCSPASFPFTYMLAFQSTAPKWSRVFIPLLFFGRSKLRSYQSAWSLPTFLPTPESEDSTAKGTSILPSALKSSASAGVMA